MTDWEAKLLKIAPSYRIARKEPEPAQTPTLPVATKETAQERYNHYLRLVAKDVKPFAVWYRGAPVNRAHFEKDSKRVLSEIGLHAVRVSYKTQPILYVSPIPTDSTIAKWAIESRSVKLVPVHGIGTSATRLYRIGAYDWTIGVFIDYWLSGRKRLGTSFLESLHEQYLEAARHARTSRQKVLARQAKRQIAHKAGETLYSAIERQADARQVDTLFKAYRAFCEAARHASLTTPIRTHAQPRPRKRQTPMLVNAGMDY